MSELVQIAKVYESPSKQKRFDECELLGQLTYLDRWEPLEAHNSLAPRLRGNGFARACEIIHKALRDDNADLLDNRTFIDEVIEQATLLFNRQYTYCTEKGIRFKPGTDEVSRAELRRIIPLYISQTPLRKHWKVTQVEYAIKSHSVRPDLGGIDPQGFDFVGDMKYKSSLEARYENDTIEEFHWDFQFQQYNDAWRSDRGLGPDRPVYSYLFLVIGSPFRIKPVGWLYTPEQQAIWQQSAAALTDEIRTITSGKRLPRASTTHRTKFGWCTMKKACLEYYLDPELMKRDYVQLDELPE